VPDPAAIATSAQFRPDLGYAFADDPAKINPPHTTISSTHVSTFYTVQEGDTLAAVAQALYGANVPQTRAKLLNAGFFPGNTIEVGS
jgi:nucleoid-associated protein YgaU